MMMMAMIDNLEKMDVQGTWVSPLMSSSSINQSIKKKNYINAQNLKNVTAAALLTSTGASTHKEQSLTNLDWSYFEKSSISNWPFIVSPFPVQTCEYLMPAKTIVIFIQIHFDDYTNTAVIFIQIQL